MVTPKGKSKKAVKETAVEYEVDGQYMPVKDQAAALDATFRDPDIKHGLTIFAAHEQGALDLWKKGEKYYLHCLIRQKKIYAKPEEIIRQLCIKRLLDLGYSAEQMTLEVPIKMVIISATVRKATSFRLYRDARS